MYTKNCLFCGKEFNIKFKSRLRLKCCSKLCREKRQGEYLKTLNRKKTRTPQICKNCNEVYFKKNESDKRSYCSKNCRSEGMSKRYSGEKSPTYKGGLTDYRRKIRSNFIYKSAQKAIFDRDDYSCQMCGKRGGLIEMHHIKPFSENKDLRYETYNLITLCNLCHNKTKHKEKEHEKTLHAILERRLLDNFYHSDIYNLL